MIATEHNIKLYLIQSDYTSDEAEKTIKTYSDLVDFAIEAGYQAEDVGNEIILQHMKDLDAS